MLFKYVEDNKGPDAPTHVAVIFDKGSHTFRNDIYDQYKANREAMPEDLRPQIPLTRDATRAFNIACIEMEGFEADDIIATLACQARDAGGRVTIISSDKDLMQLVGDGVEMLDAMKNKRIGVDEVEEKFGVRPERVVDVQALAGDSVDNVPGAPGIGIKTAALLINEYGDLETLLERAEEIKQPKRRQTLIDNADQIRLSKRLVTLDCDMDLDFTLDRSGGAGPGAGDAAGVPGGDGVPHRHAPDRRRAGRRGPGDRGPRAGRRTSPASPRRYRSTPMPMNCVRDAAALQVWIDRINERGWVAVDTETTGLNEMRADLVGISLCVEPGQACYIPLTHRAAATRRSVRLGRAGRGADGAGRGAGDAEAGAGGSTPS